MTAKPFLKWAGGKGRLLPFLRRLLPDRLRPPCGTPVKPCSGGGGRMKPFPDGGAYVEPFLGGGAMFFDLMAQADFDSALLADAAPPLICAYAAVKYSPDDLTSILAGLQATYLAASAPEQKTFFYDLRARFNMQTLPALGDEMRGKAASDPESGGEASRADRPTGLTRGIVDHCTPAMLDCAAQFIFLNKTCFNGLTRYNSRGEFNVPIGRYARPLICDAENLSRVSALLQRATLFLGDFSQALSLTRSPAFVYYDPPYRPLSPSSSFTAYTGQRFTDADQCRLAEEFHRLDAQGVLQMLSNSDPQNVDPQDRFFDDLYSACAITRIQADRAINANGRGRGPISELVITNYPV